MSLQDTIEDKDKAIIELAGIIHRTIDRVAKLSKELEATKMVIEAQREEAHQLQTRIDKLEGQLQIYKIKDHSFYLQVGGNYVCSFCKWHTLTVDEMKLHIREIH